MKRRNKLIREIVITRKESKPIHLNKLGRLVGTKIKIKIKRKIKRRGKVVKMVGNNKYNRYIKLRKVL